jgi:hypothetical protein
LKCCSTISLCSFLFSHKTSYGSYYVIIPILLLRSNHHSAIDSKTEILPSTFTPYI